MFSSLMVGYGGQGLPLPCWLILARQKQRPVDKPERERPQRKIREGQNKALDQGVIAVGEPDLGRMIVVNGDAPGLKWIALDGLVQLV